MSANHPKQTIPGRGQVQISVSWTSVGGAYLLLDASGAEIPFTQRPLKPRMIHAMTKPTAYTRAGEGGDTNNRAKTRGDIKPLSPVFGNLFEMDGEIYRELVQPVTHPEQI